MADVKVIIDVDDKFSRRTLHAIRQMRTQAAASVNKQRKQLNKNWIDWIQGVQDLRGRVGPQGPGGGGRGGGGGGRGRGRPRKKKVKDPIAEAARRAKRIRAMAKSPKRTAVKAAKFGTGRALTSALPAVAGLASKAALPIAVAYAAYKLAQTANEGLSVLGGAIGAMGGSFGGDLQTISDSVGESVFDRPSKIMSAVQSGTTMALAFAKGRVPLGKDALMGVADFAYEEEGWKKQRERRDRQEFGGALGTIIQQMTDYGK